MNHTHYRFFVSYCKADEAIARVVVDTLKVRHYVKEMSQLEPGDDFAKEIRRWIDWSHFVIPVMTEHSKDRPWIHQEVGYALGRHVRLVPIMFRCGPGSLAFLDKVHAVCVNDLSGLEKNLRGIRWEENLNRIKDRSPFPVSTCDSDATFRSKLLAEAAREVSMNFPKAHMRIRQCSRLTSFSLPQSYAAGAWKSVVGMLHDLFWVQAEERQAFQMISDHGRCDLRIDPDHYEYPDGRNRLFQTPPRKAGNSARPGYIPSVQLARLQTLRDFLDQKQDKDVEVVVDDEFASSDSVTIIGDHWMAFSVTAAPSAKFRKTIWTSHAPTIAWECEKFDNKFATDLLEQQSRIGQRSSRLFATERLDRAIEAIRRVKV